MLKTKTIYLLIVLAGFLSLPAVADIRIDQETVIEAGGKFSSMNSTTTSSTLYSKNKTRTESSMEAKGILGRLLKNSDQVAITRLDRDLIWSLTPAKKTYTEMTFAQLRELLNKNMAQLESMQQSGAAALPVTDANCQWGSAITETDKTGQKVRIAGIKASQYITTVKQTCNDIKTGKSCQLTWIIENWMAKKMPGEREIEAFSKEALKKMGMETVLTGQNMSAVLTGMFSGGWDEAQKSTAKIKGYPLKTIMSLRMGGEQCTTSGGQSMAMDGIWGNAANAGINAGIDSAASEAGYAVGREIAQKAGNSVGGRIGGSVLGAASGELIGGLFNKLKRSKNKPKIESGNAQASGKATEETALFKIVTEVIRVDDDAIASSEFEVPGGYKKVKIRGL